MQARRGLPGEFSAISRRALREREASFTFDGERETSFTLDRSVT